MHRLALTAFTLGLALGGALLGASAARAQDASGLAAPALRPTPAVPALVYRGGLRPARPAAARILDGPGGTAVSDTLLNRQPVDDPWLAQDKAQHVVFSFLITLGAQYTLVNKLGARERTALPLSAATSLSFGVAKELYDARSPRGVASRRDLVADAVGILLATGLILL